MMIMITHPHILQTYKQKKMGVFFAPRNRNDNDEDKFQRYIYIHMVVDRKKEIQKLYANADYGMVGKIRFYENVRKFGYTRKEVFEAYDSIGITQQYKNKTVKKEQRFSIYSNTGYDYQADLLFIAYDSKKKIILNVININSRRLYTRIIKQKTADETLEAMASIIDEAKAFGWPIDKLTTDGGLEFVNGKMKQLFAENNIRHDITEPNNHNRNGVIERVNQTIRAFLEKSRGLKPVKEAMSNVEILKHVRAYNKQIHPSTRVAPNKFTSEDNSAYVHVKQKRNEAISDILLEGIDIGTRVRYRIDKELFDKGTRKFSKNVFRVVGYNPYTVLLSNGKSVKLYDINIVKGEVNEFNNEKEVEEEYAPTEINNENNTVDGAIDVIESTIDNIESNNNNNTNTNNDTVIDNNLTTDTEKSDRKKQVAVNRKKRQDNLLKSTLKQHREPPTTTKRIQRKIIK